MRSYLACLVALPFLQVVNADCTYAGRRCKWVGTAPFCGQHRDGNGHVCTDPPDSTYQCFRGTQDESISELRKRIGDSFENCYRDYGSGCVTGYKNLYCKVID